MKASITLESSIIYPIIITVTCILILYGFNMHDRLSTKATAYTSLIQQYHNQNISTSDSSVQESINTVCLLPNSSTIYEYNSNKAVINHRLGRISTSFSNYDRCQFIRNIDTILRPFK